MSIIRNDAVDIAQKTIWQVGAGDGDKNYAKLCLQRDVIIVGPGRKGPWPECEVSLLSTNWTKRKMGMLRRFSERIQPGDLIVLRVGTQTAYGVGEVVGPYSWKPVFADVQGWDLQHTRRVRWLWQNAEHPQMFPVYTLKFGDSVQRTEAPAILTWLASLQVSAEALLRPLLPLPEGE